MREYPRHKTDYPGVWFIEGKAFPNKRTKTTLETEKIYYIAYRKEGKLIEEKAGRQFSDNMTPAKASEIRALRKKGKQDSNTERRAKRKDSIVLNTNRPNIKFLFSKYLEYKGDSLKGVRTDKSRFTNHLEGTLGKLTPQEIDSFTVNRLKKSIDQKHTSGSTRNVLELLRRIINFGVKNKLCSPLDFVIELPKVESERIEVLTDEQFKGLSEAWNEYPDKHIVNLHKVIAWTGMRPSEPCSLKWEDVDFKHSVIMKRNTKSGKDKPLRMSKEVTTIMIDQRTLLESEASEMRNSAFVFPRRDGGKRNPDGWRKNVKEICIRAGIPKSYRPNYCLRDTIASTMLSNGLTLDQVGYMLGHEPGSPMMKRYAKFVKGEQQRIVDRTNEMMKNKFQSQKEVIDIELYRTNNSA